MTDQQKTIYDLILKRDVMTVHSLTVVLGLTENQAKENLDALLSQGLIKTCMISDFETGRKVRAYRSPLADEALSE